MKLLCTVVLCVMIVGALAIPVQQQPSEQPSLKGDQQDQIVIVAKDPTKRAELVRKARQIYEDINIDIVQGGGGFGGYGGYGGFNGGYGGFNGGYGGYNGGFSGFNGGYGGYGGYNQGFGPYGGYVPNGYGYTNGFFG